MSKEETRFPFTGGNSDLLAVRLPKALFKAIEEEAKNEGIPLPDYVRAVLYNFFSVDIASGYFKKIKVEAPEPEDAQKRLTELDERLGYYVENVNKIIAENKNEIERLSNSILKAQALRTEVQEYMEKMLSSASRKAKKVTEEIGRLHT